MFLDINLCWYIYFLVAVVYRIICALAAVAEFKHVAKPKLWTWNFQLDKHLVVAKVDGFNYVHLYWGDVFVDLLFFLYALESASAIHHVEILLG